MKRNKLLLLLALLMTAATGAMAQTTYTVAGSNTAMFGLPWNPSSTANDMTKNGDGTYSITYTNVNFTENEEVQYKVVKNHSWDEAYPDADRVIKIAKAGTYTVTIHFNPTTHEVYETMPGYTVTLADGTEDADKWTIEPKQGLSEGDQVTVTYNGEKRVKSVKAVKKAVDPAKAYLTWDADQKKLVATEIPAGATTVTSSTTDVTWDAGTYVVEGEVAIGGRITLNGNVELIIKDDAKLTVNQIYGGDSKYNLSIYGQANQTGQLIVNSSGGHAIYLITTLNVHSCQVTATSSGSGSYGFSDITTINVYGGSVDAESTGDYGNGIKLPLKGSMNIYGGEVKVVGKGNFSGIGSSYATTVTVYGGKLWAENAGFKAIDFGHVTLTKGDGFSGKIEYSSDNSTWSETKDTGAKYVRAGY